jgi:hypothetical protein
MSAVMKRGLLGVLVTAVAMCPVACANGGPVAGDYGSGDDGGGPGSVKGNQGDDGGASADAAFGNNDNGNQGSGGGDASQSTGNQGNGDDAGNPPPPDDAGSMDSGKPPPPPKDAGNNNATCADPNTPASCHACSGKSCQPNGCYGGYVCDTMTDKCKAPNSCP